MDILHSPEPVDPMGRPESRASSMTSMNTVTYYIVRWFSRWKHLLAEVFNLLRYQIDSALSIRAFKPASCMLGASYMLCMSPIAASAAKSENLFDHQQKTFPSGRNGSVRVDALHQSRQRHPGGGLLRARRQYHASHCTSPSDRSFAVSSSDSASAFSDAPESTCSYGGAFRTLRDLTIRIVKFWSSAGDLVPYSQSSGS